MKTTILDMQNITILKWAQHYIIMNYFHSEITAEMQVSAEQKRKQVAQLWQTNRAKLETISINVQRYSQNHA